MGDAARKVRKMSRRTDIVVCRRNPTSLVPMYSQSEFKQDLQPRKENFLKRMSLALVAERSGQ